MKIKHLILLMLTSGILMACSTNGGTSDVAGEGTGGGGTGATTAAAVGGADGGGPTGMR